VGNIVGFVQARLDEDAARLEQLRLLQPGPDAIMWVEGDDNSENSIGVEIPGQKRYRRWWLGSDTTDWGWVMHPTAVELFSRVAVERALCDVDVKRRLLAKHAPVIDGTQSSWTWFEGSESASEEVVRLLALPYADHPDYREEWRP
jgi:hypothetical protein